MATSHAASHPTKSVSREVLAGRLVSGSELWVFRGHACRRASSFSATSWLAAVTRHLSELGCSQSVRLIIFASRLHPLEGQNLL